VEAVSTLTDQWEKLTLVVTGEDIARDGLWNFIDFRPANPLLPVTFYVDSLVIDPSVPGDVDTIIQTWNPDTWVRNDLEDSGVVDKESYGPYWQTRLVLSGLVAHSGSKSLRYYYEGFTSVIPFDDQPALVFTSSFLGDPGYRPMVGNVSISLWVYVTSGSSHARLQLWDSNSEIVVAESNPTSVFDSWQELTISLPHTGFLGVTDIVLNMETPETESVLYLDDFAILGDGDPPLIVLHALTLDPASFFHAHQNTCNAWAGN
jgi:hypothetical protein